MNLQLSGHHLDITPAIRSYVTDKLSRVTRHFDHVIDVNVILSVDKLDQKIEAKVHVRGKDIYVECVDANMYAAIDGLVDKLDRQILKHKEKSVDHHQGGCTVIFHRTSRTPGMSLLSKLLPVANVILGLDVTSKKRVFEHVGLLFENALGIGRGQVFDALLARERLGSTGLGHGIAIPHGRIKGLREAAGAFVRTSAPIPFEAPDGNPVQLIFVLLVPEKATDLHLQILSELAQMFSDKEVRAQLAALPDARDVQRLISEWEPHAPGQRRAAV